MSLKIGDSLGLIKSISHQLKRDCFFNTIETKCTFKSVLWSFVFLEIKKFEGKESFQRRRCDPCKCKHKTIGILKKQTEIKDKSEKSNPMWDCICEMVVCNGF